jgi:putative nucleotidyltransferase with HDIG domain
VIDLTELVKKAQEIEPLPKSASRLASLLARADSETEEVVQTVSTDPALTARVLRAANSAANAARVPARTARDAILRLGRGSVLSIAVASGVQKKLQGSIPAYGLRHDELWRHSVAASFAVEAMAPHCNVPIPPEAATAALLHDVGKIVMAQFLSPDTLDVLMRAQREGGLSERQAETTILGANHAELGALMAQSWHLAESLVKGIQYHHDPDTGREPICDVVCVADAVAWSMPEQTAHNPMRLDEFEPSLKRLGIDAAALDEIRATCAARLQEMLARYGS